jgi:hypothetical protein
VKDELLDQLLAKPVGSAASTAAPKDQYTSKVEVKGDVVSAEVHVAPDEDENTVVRATLEAAGLNPDEWKVTGLRTGSWTMPSGEAGSSVRFTFGPATPGPDFKRPNIEELLEAIDDRPMEPRVMHHIRDLNERAVAHTYIVALGDTQFGKIDGDGAEGTLRRVLNAIDSAADIYSEHYAMRFWLPHIHIAWLGDHVEGFVSQGGQNAWRTTLTLTEQIRLTRRVMLYALQKFYPLCSKLTMAAVPGNHGEAVRFASAGVTRYDDSLDTESLIAVSDATQLYPDRFENVEFFVPDTDELTVVLDCSGTTVAHAHGHKWRGGKHFEWWKGQAFSSPRLGSADLLLAGHLHHEFIDTDGPRTFVQVPSFESESTWFRHHTGTVGAPGLIVMVTANGEVPVKEVVRG